MKRIILTVGLFILLSTNLTFSQVNLNRLQMDEILFAAATRVNLDMGKSYTLADARKAYDRGILVLNIMGADRDKLTVQYSFFGCVGIVITDA